MAIDRRFRFGAQLTGAIADMSWAETARHVEALGYDTLHLPDHFGDQLAPIPAMMAAAAATTELNVGCLVFDNDYRHPVVLAKEIATIDVLSGGRVEFGLGAGWMRSDYEQSGIAYDEPAVRVERFMEAVTVSRRLWSEGTVDHQGVHYAVHGLDGLPKPCTHGGPKLLIGGGAPRMLRFAGEQADIVGINPSIRSGAIDADAARDSAADRFDRKVAWVREGAGDRFDDVELNVLVFMATITDDAASVADALGPMFGVDAADVLESPSVLAGTVDEICDQLRRRRDRWGVSYVVFQQDVVEAMAPVVARLAGT